MGSSGKLSNSETSSEEIDQPAGDQKLMIISDDNTGIGRSYECNFCKRGFTNAQALGGHMNIHRKDKAKAKQKKQDHHHEPSSMIINKSYEDYSSSSSKYFAPNIPYDHQQQRPYGTALAAYMSYQLYFPSSNPSNYNDPNAYNNQYDHHHHHHLGIHEFRVDQASLSLSIGPGPSCDRADGDEGKIGRDDIGEVDLELRLGHHP